MSLQRSQGSLRDKLAEFERQLPAMTDENMHLMHEKKELLDQVRRQNILMEDMKAQMEELRLQTREERRKRAKGISQLQYIDMGKGVLTIQNSLKFVKIGIKSCRKHKNYVALDCGLGDRDPKYPRGVPWDQNFWSKIFLISSSNDLIL